MAKTASLDIGNQWTGSAISDALGIIARPYKTVATKELEGLIQEFLHTHHITTIIVGYPKTMKGTESEQTKKVVAMKEALKVSFPSIAFILWDERLSSKRASLLSRSSTKEDKLNEHSRAAAFILDSYLQYLKLSA